MSATTLPNPPTMPRAEGERIPADSPLAHYISVDAGRMHGAPCFKGTRVPINIHFDHLRAGDPISEFLDGFPPRNTGPGGRCY